VAQECPESQEPTACQETQAEMDRTACQVCPDGLDLQALKGIQDSLGTQGTMDGGDHLDPLARGESAPSIAQLMVGSSSRMGPGAERRTFRRQWSVTSNDRIDELCSASNVVKCNKIQQVRITCGFVRAQYIVTSH
jgi:hypothetical protein